MKYLFQFGVIAAFTFLGEILYLTLGLPVPSSIYGLFLLFIALCSGAVKLDQVEDGADFMLSVMPVMFVPSTVSLITTWDILKDNIIGIFITCVLSTVIVLGVTGRIAQWLIETKEKRRRPE